MKRSIKIKSFTLAELVIVVVIVGIFAAVAIPSYRRAVLKIQDKEACAMLSLIRQAERDYRLEYSTYVGCVDTAACNATLNLSLSNESWEYSVPNSAAATFCAQAVNQDDGTIMWSVRADMAVEPGAGGCP